MLNVSTKETVGSLIRRARIRRGFTQEELARRSGVSVRTIRNLEVNRITVPRQSTLEALASTLRIDDARRAELVAHVPTQKPTLALPQPLTPMFGRDDVLAAVIAALDSTRLVTLTGMAGIGKTRLALAVAGELRTKGTPVVWVPLESVDRVELIVSAIAQAAGAPQPSMSAIAGSLPPDTVLFLDNLEQFDCAGSVIHDLLNELPSVSVLGTARTPLRVPGEQEWPVPRLAAEPARRLFVDRVRATIPDFQPTGEVAGTVAGICVHLDGLPLALELAAAQWRVRGGPALLCAIQDNPLGLSGGRHGTLGQALAASCALLPGTALDTFGKLAAFRGGWTLESAEAIIGGESVLDDLDRMLALGLVVAEDPPTGRRFTMLPILLALAESAGLATEVADRHALWFLGWAEGMREGLRRGAPAHHLRQLDAERDNLRAALAWFKQHDPSAGLGMIAALSRYWRRA